eukprot:1875680-Rhodomonas_salina.1
MVLPSVVLRSGMDRCKCLPPVGLERMTSAGLTPPSLLPYLPPYLPCSMCRTTNAMWDTEIGSAATGMRGTEIGYG